MLSESFEYDFQSNFRKQTKLTLKRFTVAKTTKSEALYVLFLSHSFSLMGDFFLRIQNRFQRPNRQ